MTAAATSYQKVEVGFFKTPHFHTSLEWWWMARLGSLFAVLALLILQQLFQRASFSSPQLFYGYGILALGFLFNLSQTLFESKIKERWEWIALNLCFDALATASWIHCTSSQDNLYLLFFLVQILLVALIFYQKAAIFYALLAGGLYGALVFLGPTEEPDKLVHWGSYAGLFLILGMVGGHLSEEVLRSTLSLREKQERLDRLTALQELILSNMGTAIVAVDDKMQVQFCNRAASEILGEPQSDLEEVNLLEKFPGLAPFFENKVEPSSPGEVEERKSALSIEKEVMASSMGLQEGEQQSPPSDKDHSSLGQVVEMERGDEVLVLRGDVAQIQKDSFNPSAQVGRFLLFQDVTQMVSLEGKVRQHEKLAAVGQLAAGIAHEIRNPLASMSASIEMLQGSMDSSEMGVENKKLMGIALKEIDRLNHLVSEFLDYVKPSKFERKPVELNEIMKEVVFAAKNLKSMGAQVVIEEIYAPEPWFYGNAEKIKQVMWNLVVNAIQAMSGAGKIQVGSFIVDENRVGFYVQDEGVGMSEKVKRHLFEPFFTTKDKGTGLGLAASYRIVEIHGGQMEVESEVGQGALFRVTLPTSSQARSVGEPASS